MRTFITIAFALLGCKRESAQDSAGGETLDVVETGGMTWPGPLKVESLDEFERRLEVIAPEINALLEQSFSIGCVRPNPANDHDGDGLTSDAKPKRADLNIHIDVMEGVIPERLAQHEDSFRETLRQQLTTYLDSAPFRATASAEQGITLNITWNTIGHEDTIDLTKLEVLRKKARERLVKPLKPGWRYAVWADSDDDGRCGAFDGCGAFYLSLGPLYRRYAAILESQQRGLKTDERAALEMAEQACFMHELGHTFGLTHGGPLCVPNDAGRECKNLPNHLSVMSYRWALKGVVEDSDDCSPDAGVPKYQDLAFAGFSEATANGANLELSGGGSVPAGRRVEYQVDDDGALRCQSAAAQLEWLGAGRIDMNGDGAQTSIPATVNEWQWIADNRKLPAPHDDGSGAHMFIHPALKTLIERDEPRLADVFPELSP